MEFLFVNRFAAIDSDHSQYIEYEEFLAAAKQVEEVFFLATGA